RKCGNVQAMKRRDQFVFTAHENKIVRITVIHMAVAVPTHAGFPPSFGTGVDVKSATAPLLLKCQGSHLSPRRTSRGLSELGSRFAAHFRTAFSVAFSVSSFVFLADFDGPSNQSFPSSRLPGPGG